MSARFDAVVVGAGFAGIAASTAIAERGGRVLVLEARQRPGGRAISWTDPSTGEIHDNGQHVLGAFYDDTVRLLRRLGTESALAVEPTFHLRVWERGRGTFELHCPNLPAPFHWLAAVATCARLSPAARISALGLRERARAILSRNGDGSTLTVDEWLRQGPGSADVLAVFRPMALAALNEDPGEGSAMLFARVLEHLLASPAARSGLALPRRGMSELFRGFDEFIVSRGGEVRYRETVLGVRVSENRVAGVSVLGGGMIPCTAAVLAVPHDRAGWMLAPEHWGEYLEVTRVPWSPIVSTVHVFDRPILPSRFVGLAGTKTQWAFDRGSTSPGRHMVGTVRSAAFVDVSRSTRALADETALELTEAFPAAASARLLASRVYKERRATMRAIPDVQRLRPPAETRVRGLFLAGDWTATGLPPTIEGAVLSGHRAASLLS